MLKQKTTKVDSRINNGAKMVDSMPREFAMRLTLEEKLVIDGIRKSKGLPK